MADSALKDAPANPQFDPAMVKQVEKAPLVLNNRDYHWITEKICGIVEVKTNKWWWILFIPSFLLMLWVPFGFTYLILTGIGVWGQNAPVFWAWDITNFVFWIGIGHAGTLISAILFLTRQKWRTSINRAAEAMTIFAVICAGLYPALHVGRVWMAWFLAPLPNANGIWQNFRSPLLWDVFAVSTYFTVSLLFWYMGLIPDIATLRDRATSKIKRFAYGFFALGWRGGNRHWRNYEMAYLILAGISTPLVLSVHTIVSFDFATSVIPGWHTTIFPPYFVAGAIFGGFAMVLTLMLPARYMLGLHDLITDKHVDIMAKIILLTGSIVGYAYIMEFFIAWYSQNPFEQWAFLRNRISDPYIFSRVFDVPPAPYWWAYWCMMSFNVISPQLFWFKWCRYNVWVVFAVCMAVNAGMWFERFVIIVTSIHRDFLPGSWGMYSPTWVDIMTFIGSHGLFLTLFLIFCRFLPMIAISEVKGVLPQSDPHHGHDDHSHAADHSHAPAEESKAVGLRGQTASGH
ncbi:MAG: polysulfide reductase NrfD [Verrucomicrobia bacterium]|nr:polysulfide reductase NrfD [Verrucomicrobiota bacterium]